jgi:hypothetical protein
VRLVFGDGDRDAVINGTPGRGTPRVPEAAAAPARPAPRPKPAAGTDDRQGDLF